MTPTDACRQMLSAKGRVRVVELMKSAAVSRNDAIRVMTELNAGDASLWLQYCVEGVDARDGSHLVARLCATEEEAKRVLATLAVGAWMGVHSLVAAAYKPTAAAALMELSGAPMVRMGSAAENRAYPLFSRKQLSSDSLSPFASRSGSGALEAAPAADGAQITRTPPKPSNVPIAQPAAASPTPHSTPIVPPPQPQPSADERPSAVAAPAITVSSRSVSVVPLSSESEAPPVTPPVPTPPVVVVAPAAPVEKRQMSLFDMMKGKSTTAAASSPGPKAAAPSSPGKPTAAASGNDQRAAPAPKPKKGAPKPSAKKAVAAVAAGHAPKKSDSVRMGSGQHLLDAEESEDDQPAGDPEAEEFRRMAEEQARLARDVSSVNDEFELSPEFANAPVALAPVPTAVVNSISVSGTSASAPLVASLKRPREDELAVQQTPRITAFVNAELSSFYKRWTKETADDVAFVNGQFESTCVVSFVDRATGERISEAQFNQLLHQEKERAAQKVASAPAAPAPVSAASKPATAAPAAKPKATPSAATGGTPKLTDFFKPRTASA